MITVKDQVSMMWGKEVADTLADEGLLRPDTADEVIQVGSDHEVHTYRVYFRADLRHTFWAPGNTQYASHSLKSGFKAGINQVRNLLDARANSTKRMWPNASWYLDRADEILGWQFVDIKSKSTARNQSTMIRNNGFETRVVPLAMVELPEIHF